LQLKAVALCADGYIYRCDNHIGNSKYAIVTIKKGITRNNPIDKEFICSTITEHCLKCKLLPICAGGLCRYEELKKGKSCELMKGKFKQNMTNYLKYVNPM
jgi:radical SAM protein with 4Fe4S-binding SPASM domain